MPKGIYKRNLGTFEERKNRFILRHKNAKLDKKHIASLVGYGYRVGYIIKSNICEMCGSNKEISGHHKDYKKPLEIVWLCKNCHSKIHHPRGSLWGSNKDKKKILDKKKIPVK